MKCWSLQAQIFFSESDLFNQQHVDSVEMWRVQAERMKRLACCLKETYGIEYSAEEIERLSSCKTSEIQMRVLVRNAPAALAIAPRTENDARRGQPQPLTDAPKRWQGRQGPTAQPMQLEAIVAKDMATRAGPAEAKVKSQEWMWKGQSATCSFIRTRSVPSR